jgi:predicted DNA-binding transcriptional regulator AlpA
VALSKRYPDDPERIANGEWFCSKCDTWRPLNQFHHRSDRNKAGIPRPERVCRICAAEKSRNFLQPRIEALQKIKLERGCERCGYSENAVALDFEHDPPKLGGLGLAGKISRTSIPLDNLIAEANECIVLCANCHRIVSAEAGFHLRANWSDDSLLTPGLRPKQSDPEAGFLSTADVARRFGVNDATIARWCAAGRFPHAERLKDSRWRIPEADLP